MTLPPPIAACRHGVRRALADLAPGATVVVACSGGPDSLALASAAVHEARSAALRVVGVTVDHGLQEGSAPRAEVVAHQLRELGCAGVHVVPVQVVPAGRGPEAAARRARYAALTRLAEQESASCVLLGHTRDDQAETVLLGLARGSGARSLAGMPARAGIFRRPLLAVPRADTVAACEAAGLPWWDDPHNEDARYARVRVRRRVLPLLEEQLGPGVREALARTADLLRDDAEALDALAATAYEELVDRDRSLPTAGVLDHPRAVATRVLRRAAIEAGAIDAELFHVHVRALWDLTTGALRGEVQLPGPVSARRVDGEIRFTGTGVPS